MLAPEQTIWQNLIEVSPRGFLRWRDDIQLRSGMESRSNPERFMAMCGNLRTLEQHNPTLIAGDLEPVGYQEYTTKNGEITGLNGLLRLVDRFNYHVARPRDILLVGSISSNSLLSLMKWCQVRGWSDSHITMVDESPVVANVLREMATHGNLDWGGGLDIIENDVLKYDPDRPQDLVVADILNRWMVEEWQYPNLSSGSPYKDFEALLAWSKQVLSPNGFLLSRTMIMPEDKPEIDPNIRFRASADRMTEKVVAQLGSLAEIANVGAIRDMLEELFDKPPREGCCGLEGVLQLFDTVETLAGPHAEKVFDRLHNRNFEKVDKLVVRDEKSGYVFQNFLCQ